MGFASVSDLIAEITGGSGTGTIKKGDVDWYKTYPSATTSAAGRAHECFTWTGLPIAGSWAGTAGVATSLTNSSTGACPLNAAVSTDTRHLLNLLGYTNSSVVTPAMLYLLDYLLYYPAMVVTGTPTVPDNTVTLPRYTTGDGVQCMIAVQTALGAASPALTLTYTDQGGTGSNTGILTAPANSAPVSTLFQTSGGIFLPLAAGDSGVKKVDSYTLASGTTGTVSMILVKVIAEIPLVAQHTPTERDFVFQMSSLPQIVDGACLGFAISIGGAMTTSQTIKGRYEYAWG